jgi:hypothetical protein
MITSIGSVAKMMSPRSKSPEAKRDPLATRLGGAIDDSKTIRANLAQV